MPDQTVSGSVQLVRFLVGRDRWLTIWLAERETAYQLTNSELFLDGRPVTKHDLIVWLAGFPDGAQPPRATITLDPDSYVPYRRVEFRTPEG